MMTMKFNFSSPVAERSLRMRTSRNPVRWAALFVTIIFSLLFSSSAEAYPWMIRHAYTDCVTCHTDPSGSGLLTDYGREQGDLLLRTRYSREDAEVADKTAGFLWGLVDPPTWLRVGGEGRTLNYWYKPAGYPTQSSFVLMQADLQAEVRFGGFRANGSLGFTTTSGGPAAVSNSLVSREHWVGYGWGNDAFLLRAGRINLPFGIRMIEHTFFVRAATRTDLNDTQQHGVAFAYTGEHWRGELMAIAGNYQISPDKFRERGYSGYVEWAPIAQLALGASSLITHAAASVDPSIRAPDTRQAHGVFVRAVPIGPLVLMGEADLVVHTPTGLPSAVGYASVLQADWEIIQGVHLLGTAEQYKPNSETAQSYHGWLSAGWFFAPHADVRLDYERARDAIAGGRYDSTAYLVQLHVYL
jgi:hypothetical protein